MKLFEKYWWWTCPLCFDRMEIRSNEREVDRDRVAHLAAAHSTTTSARIEHSKPCSWQGQQ